MSPGFYEELELRLATTPPPPSPSSDYRARESSSYPHTANYRRHANLAYFLAMIACLGSGSGPLFPTWAPGY
jgi:hypothetical protein